MKDRSLEPLTPVYTADLFPPLHQELLALLRGLAPADWERPTVAGSWRLRDVAAHLLDVDLRKLSIQRDGHLVPPEEPIGGYGDLVRFLNRLNADWVAASRRLSPRVLVDLLATTGPAVSEVVAALPPHEPATFSVSWAGESRSENWFDVGREYTERWHHQMQIRDAVGAPLLLERRWLHPLLDLSVRALPRAYESVAADPGGGDRLRGHGHGRGFLVPDPERRRMERLSRSGPRAGGDGPRRSRRLLAAALQCVAPGGRCEKGGDRRRRHARGAASRDPLSDGVDGIPRLYLLPDLEERGILHTGDGKQYIPAIILPILAITQHYFPICRVNGDLKQNLEIYTAR